jgi:shikimate dehydrogenase
MTSHQNAYVVGCPIAHSISPAIHNAAFRDRGLPVTYSAREVEPRDLPQAIGRLRADDVIGANITVPHKEAVLSHVDEIDDEALTIGAANTIHNLKGRLRAANTDAIGFLRSLVEAGVEVGGADVLLLGAGGSARAVGHALLGAGAARLVVANRGVDRAERLAADLENRFPKSAIEICSLATAARGDFKHCSLVVNTTTVGLATDETPLPRQALPSSGAVVDLIYDPPRTRLLRIAGEAGLRTLNGLPMLVHQAAASWEIWMRQPAPIEVMWTAARSALSHGR